MPRAYFAILLMLASCVTDDETYRCPSPGNRYVAIFRTESGGGAAGFSYEHVYVLDSINKNEDRVLTLKGGYDVRLIWFDSANLRIEYPDRARIDHWQNWFGYEGDGRVDIVTVSMSGGKLTSGAGGCAK